jgi:hypothetical protein
MNATVYFVGRDAEVAHHAAPFRERCQIQIAEPQDVTDRARPGDLAIFYSEHFDRFRDACRQLKQRRVATLYLIDGILEWRNAWENQPDELACPFTMRPALADKIACIGVSQARVLESWGNQDKTEVVGIARLESLRSRLIQQPPQHSTDNEKFRLLVMTAKTPAFTPRQWQATRQSLRDMQQWLEKHPTLQGRRVEVTWRLTRGLERELGVENSLRELSGMELAGQLDRVDAVITTPSTAMLEAMIRDLPVALLDYHGCPRYVQSGWAISSRQQIAPAISQLAERTERRMLYQRNQLLDALYLESDNVQRVEQLIRRMLAHAASQLSSQSEKPLTFPPNLLSQPSNLFAGFSHQRVFPGVEEFRNHDRVELQTELAQARRRIAALNCELDQLRSELGQAHQIFETINSHPIAGPIVRVRQKMLDLMVSIQQRIQGRENDESNNIYPTGVNQSKSVDSDPNSCSPHSIEDCI